MLLSEYKFLSDENIDQEAVGWLRHQFITVKDVKEEGLFGAKDIELLALAEKEGLVIITQDSDFGTLMFRNNTPLVSVIFLRPGHYNWIVHINTLSAVFSLNPDLNHPFFIVAENKGETIKIRIREL